MYFKNKKLKSFNFKGEILFMEKALHDFLMKRNELSLDMFQIVRFLTFNSHNSTTTNLNFIKIKSGFAFI